MADKTYVKVNAISAKNVFDKKYQTTMPKVIAEAFSKAIDKSSLLTTKPPADKKATTMSLDGSLTLTQTKKGIDGKLSMAMAKDNSMFGMPSSQAKIDMDPAKVSDSDVRDLVDGLVDAIVDDVVKQFEKKAKAK
jgi:hypothetical protein